MGAFGSALEVAEVTAVGSSAASRDRRLSEEHADRHQEDDEEEHAEGGEE